MAARVDLITGFLGSGKTTFIQTYARYLMRQGQRVGIIENDYGSVNVDLMLLQDLEREGAVTEMVIGGDLSCYRRRFRTKLITMGMQNLDRVLVEPSGVFDVDEFFDAMYEDTISSLCGIGSVISIVDASMAYPLDRDAAYLLVSEVADAGMVLLSHAERRKDGASDRQADETVRYLNQAMQQFGCSRRFVEQYDQKTFGYGKDILVKDWSSLTDADFERISEASYRAFDHVKLQTEQAFQTLYYMNLGKEKEELMSAASELLGKGGGEKENRYGQVLRIKGFFREGGKWYELNATRTGLNIRALSEGQDVLIAIGEHLDTKAIDERIGARHI